jgi:restriction system protein
LTTAKFSREAEEYAHSVSSAQLALIVGASLARLMIEHGAGVSVQKTYNLSRVDENYFQDDVSPLPPLGA